jgi:squalene-hopene/tetraprenyl-beta-curcumene cyclase
MKDGSIKRSLTVSLVSLLLAASMMATLPNAVADETLPPATPTGIRTDVQEAVIEGLDWLVSRQAVDGSWGGIAGVTGLVLLAFTGAGYDYTNQTVQRGLAFMRNFHNPIDGWLADAFPNYESAIAIMAMSSAGDPKDAGMIAKITEFVQSYQFTDSTWYNMTRDWYFGGWPNQAGIPDISNTQFALLGLQCAELYNPSISVDPAVWSHAVQFTHICQNWPSLNTLGWAHNASLPSFDDGGFVYNGYRSRTIKGEEMFESYGSITAAGLFNYLVSGEVPTQAELIVARKWLDERYTFDQNPNMGGNGLYYYLWTQSRVLAMSSQDWVVDGSGKLHDWRAEVASYFMGIQQKNGGWLGNPQSGWREEEPELAAMYALLAMQSAYLMVPEPELTIEVTGSDGVSFIDPMGNKLVSDATRGLEVTTSTLSCTNPEVFRKIWVSASGDPGKDLTVTATGTWGEGRSSTTSKTVPGKVAGTTFHVATGGFSGPFGIHITAFEDAPWMETVVPAIELVPGETKVVEIGLEETTGKGPIQMALLVAHLPEGTVADVDFQGIEVTAGGKAVMGVTISVPEDVGTDGTWSLVITSATSPPVTLPVSLVDPDPEEGPTTLYWAAILVLVLVTAVFFILPKLGRRE